MNKKILGVVLAVLLVGGVFYFVQAQGTAQEIPPLSETQYKRASAKDVFVILVAQAGCRPCRIVEKRIFLPLLNEYASDQQVHVVKIEVTQAGNFEKEMILNKFNVKRTPTVLIVQSGQNVWKKDDFPEGREGVIFNEIINTVNTI